MFSRFHVYEKNSHKRLEFHNVISLTNWKLANSECCALLRSICEEKKKQIDVNKNVAKQKNDADVSVEECGTKTEQ